MLTSRFSFLCCSCVDIVLFLSVFAELVPRKISYNQFWIRYFYALHLIHEKEQKRKALLDRFLPKSDGDGDGEGWGGDDWGDDASSSAPAAPPSQAVPPSAPSEEPPKPPLERDLRKLRARIKKFDDDFVAKNGRKPTARDRRPIQDVVLLYKEVKAEAERAQTEMPDYAVEPNDDAERLDSGESVVSASSDANAQETVEVTPDDSRAMTPRADEEEKDEEDEDTQEEESASAVERVATHDDESTAPQHERKSSSAASSPQAADDAHAAVPSTADDMNADDDEDDVLAQEDEVVDEQQQQQQQDEEGDEGGEAGADEGLDDTVVAGGEDDTGDVDVGGGQVVAEGPSDSPPSSEDSNLGMHSIASSASEGARTDPGSSSSSFEVLESPVTTPTDSPVDPEATPAMPEKGGAGGDEEGDDWGDW